MTFRCTDRLTKTTLMLILSGTGGMAMEPPEQGTRAGAGLTEERARRESQHSIFDVPGSVSKSPHAGILWLRYLL